jgi:hypothetical protein
LLRYLQERLLIPWLGFAAIGCWLRCAMNWKNERDLFIAQTLAFVQSLGSQPLGSQQPDLARAIQPRPVGLKAVERRPEWKPVDAAKIDNSNKLAAPEIQRTDRTSTGPGDFRREIEKYILNFRAHQQRFHREREEYFTATLARARASISSEAGLEKAPARNGNPVQSERR